MELTKEFFEELLREDMRADAEEHLADRKHEARMRSDDYDYIYSQREVIEFSEAYEDFKKFCDMYDLSVSDMIGGL